MRVRGSAGNNTRSTDRPLGVTGVSVRFPLQANSETARTPRQGKTRQVIKNQRSDNTKRRSRDMAPSIFLKPMTASPHFQHVISGAGPILNGVLCPLWYDFKIDPVAGGGMARQRELVGDGHEERVIAGGQAGIQRKFA
jgi:hypothetical protein